MAFSLMASPLFLKVDAMLRMVTREECGIEAGAGSKSIQAAAVAVTLGLCRAIRRAVEVAGG